MLANYDILWILRCFPSLGMLKCKKVYLLSSCNVVVYCLIELNLNT